MISVLGVKNSDNRKIIYTFFSGSVLEEPDFTTFPLMQDGSTWDTLDTTGDKAKIVRHVLVNGVWVEYEDGESGGDTPTPVEDPVLTAVEFVWLDLTKDAPTIIEKLSVPEGTTVDAQYLASQNVGIFMASYTPDTVDLGTSGYGYPQCTLVAMNDFMSYTLEQYLFNGNPVAIATNSGSDYVVPEYTGPDQDEVLTIVTGYKASADAYVSYVYGSLTVTVTNQE